jgi:hypothetical protein
VFVVVSLLERQCQFHAQKGCFEFVDEDRSGSGICCCGNSIACACLICCDGCDFCCGGVGDYSYVMHRLANEFLLPERDEVSVEKGMEDDGNWFALLVVR